MKTNLDNPKDWSLADLSLWANNVFDDSFPGLADGSQVRLLNAVWSISDEAPRMIEEIMATAGTMFQHDRDLAAARLTKILNAVLVAYGSLGVDPAERIVAKLTSHDPLIEPPKGGGRNPAQRVATSLDTR